MSAHAFYVAKGVAALVATILLVWHMSRTWDSISTWGQRLRYYSLLYFAVLLTEASVEQTAQQIVSIYPRNVFGIGGAVLLLAAGAVSLAESRRNR